MRSYAPVGGLIGAAVGAGAAVAFLDAFCGGDNLCNGDEELRAVLIFGVPPAVAGTVVGALIRHERWAVVPSVTPAALGGRSVGLRVRLSVR
jgi:hypothetical protein